jgi:CBS domain-containing protein
MKVHEFCTSTVVTVHPAATLQEASVLMRKAHVGALVVTEAAGAARPAGMLTDRDIVIAVTAVPGLRAETILVRDVMSTRLAVAREDDSVFEATRAMAERGVRRLPVVRQDGTLRGIVTADDLQRVMAAEMASLATALKRGTEREELERRLEILLRRMPAPPQAA